jgi:YYY domain-containing protein
MVDAIVWWLTIEVLGLVALPVAAVLLRPLPDRGYAMSKALGVLLVGWLAYTLAMLKVLPFGRLGLLACTIIVAAFSSWLLYRNGQALTRELVSRFRTARFARYILTAEVLFALLFTIWAIVRAYNPDIVDQEKFMDFGFLNSILKSGTFPPNDMWLAGNSINYYYFGYILVAAITGLSGVRTEIAFNLANVTLYSLTALGSFAVVYNLILGTILRENAPAKARRAEAEVTVEVEAPAAAPAPRKKSRAVAEELEPVVAAQAPVPSRRARSQQSVAAEEAIETSTVATIVVESDPADSTSIELDGDGHDRAERVPPSRRTRTSSPGAAPPMAAADEIPRTPFFLSPYIYAVLAALMVVAMGNLATSFAVKDRSAGADMEGNGYRFCFLCADKMDWFALSRIVQDYRTVQVPGQPATKEKVGFETINEFPAFSFLLADLHPHVLALPFVLLAVAVALAFSRRKVMRGTRWRDGFPGSVYAWTALVLAGLVVGTLYTANTWDFPTYLVVVLAGLALPYIAAQRRSHNPTGWRWTRPWLVQTAIIIFFAFLLFLPFHLTFKSLVGGAQATLPLNLANIPVLSWVLQRLSNLVLVNTADKTILGFVVIFGIFLAALVVWLLYEWVMSLRKRLSGDEPSLLSFYMWLTFFVLTIGISLLLRFPLLALLLPLSVIAIYLVLQEPGRTERNMALILFAVGALISLVIEVVFLRDNFQMRMNTLFKFYFQVWILWALAAAYGLWKTLYAAFRHRPDTVMGRSRIPVRQVPVYLKSLAGVWAALFGLLVLSGLAYSQYGPQQRQIGNQSFPPPKGLDGTLWLRDQSPGDYDAINWLKSNGSGGDVVLEAGSDEYHRPGRVSSYTGVPTLVGWDNSHEALWRTNQPTLLAEITDRRQAVNAIYRGVDPQAGGNLTAERLLELLHTYSVDYVFAGATERGEPNAAPTKPDETMTEYAEGLFKQTMPAIYTSPSGNAVIYQVKQGIEGTGQAPPPPANGATAVPTKPVPPTVDPNAPAAGLFDFGPAGVNKGQLNSPRGIARDAQGNFYVADTHNLRIEKFDSAGKFLTMWGSKGDGDGQFNPIADDAVGTGPGGVAVDKSGNVYVADTWNHRIQKFDKDGKFLGAWGNYINLGDDTAAADPQRDSKFFGPRGVAVGPDGSVYVTDTGNKRVLIFDAGGVFQRKIDSGMSPTQKGPEYPFSKPGELNEPIGISVDKDGNVYVADTNNHRIQKFDNTGKPVAQWPVQDPGWKPGPFLEPFLGVDGAGNVYATAPSGSTVLKFGPDGKLLGQKNTDGTHTLKTPTGIWVEADGTVYVVDTTSPGVANLGKIP